MPSSARSASCLCGDGRLRARPDPVSCRAEEGTIAASDHRLDLGRPDAGGGRQFVLDPPDQAAGPFEPDPSAVDFHAGDAPARRLAGASPRVVGSPPRHDRRFSPARWSSPGCSRCCRGGSCTRSFSALERPASGGGFSGPVSKAGFEARAASRCCPVSHWKNEGKNPVSEPVKGGFQALDTLYDFDSELTGFPLCLTLKIRSPESRRRLPIFVPFPSSTR